MTEWFHERYISRNEHQAVVEYYRRLVANLQHSVCELRTRVDDRTIDDLVELGARMAQEDRHTSQSDHGDNVIRFDFRSPR